MKVHSPESLLDSSLMYILSQVLIELDIWKFLSPFFLQMTTVSWGWWQATQLEDGAQKGHWGEEGGPHLPLYPERGQRHTPSILFPRWMAALWVILFYFYRILWMQQGLPLKTVVLWPTTQIFHAMIHYHKNKVGVVDFANAQGLVMFCQSVGFCKIYYSHFIFEVLISNNIPEQNSK